MQHSKEKTDSNREEEQKFQKVLSSNSAVLEPVKLNDHQALGVIDVFAKNLKRILSKEFLEQKNTKWTDILPEIIERYNNTPHSSLDDITPNQAISDPKKRQHIMHLNMLKALENGFVTDLKPGICRPRLGSDRVEEPVRFHVSIQVIGRNFDSPPSFLLQIHSFQYC